MVELFEHFHFLRPELLLVAPALLLVEWLLRHGAQWDDPFRGIIEPELLEQLRLRKPRGGWFNPASALLVLMTLAIVILAGPSWQQQPSPLAEDAAELILVMDVSESMGSEDIAPNRLERASQKMRDLIARVPDKKVGLIIYAGSAHTLLPPTQDHDIIATYLSALSTDLAPRTGKFPEYALPSVDRLLGSSLRRASVLLVTDGLGAASPDLVGAWCQTSPHQLLVYGVGNPSAQQSDTPLDKDGLSDLASSCSGRYFDLSVDTRDVERIAGALADDYLVIDDEALPWLDGGYPLVFPALAFALLWFRRGWTRAWLWLVLPFCLVTADPVVAQDNPDRAITAEAPSDAPTGAPVTERLLDGFASLWLTPDQYGKVLFSLGYYEKAARAFANPIWQATAHYYLGSFQQAASLFTRKDSDAALFNEANAHAHRKDYLRAVRRYDELLERNPSFPGAQENRDWVQAIIDEINRLSASQQQEDGVGSEELDDSDPRSAEGADELSFEKKEREQFSAEQILASPETAAMWLKGVQQNPTRFLRTKFTVQLEERGVSEQ